MDGAAETLCGGAFLADRLALARGEAVKESVKTGIARIDPVELLRDAVHQPHRGARFGLVPGAEGDVQRRHPVIGRQLQRALHQRRAARFLLPRPGQEPAPGRGGEGHGDLQLGVIAPARILVGLGPVEIEDVFALAVAFRIKRRHRDHRAALPRHQMARRPARSGPDRTRAFQRRQEAVRGERIDRAPGSRLGAGAGVPVAGVDLRQTGMNGDLDRLGHRQGLARPQVSGGPQSGTVKRGSRQHSARR